VSTTTLDVRELLARVVVRQPTLEHDGRSGARLERGVLDDGRRVVIKWSDPRTDLTGLVTSGAENRELQLWDAGVLDRLPRGVAHALLGAGWVGDQVVTVMRDLGPHVLSWNDRFVVVDLQRLFGAVASLHATFRGVPPPGLCQLDIRLSLFAPDRVRPHIGTDNPLPALIVRGWGVFAELVPHDVASQVFEALARPERIARSLSGPPTTMLHGDLWLVNIALPPAEVVLLDWALATAGPAVLDFVSFMAGCASNVALDAGALLDEIRRACGADHDERVLRLALFCGLLEQGWNKSIDAVEHPDAAVRHVQRAELDWWVLQARIALDEGLIA
jgi:phosphotransferase family enzyme